MSYYDALVTQWAALTGTTDQKLSAINALTVAGTSAPIPLIAVMTYLRTNNLWMPIKAAVATSAGAAAAVDYNSDMRVTSLDASLPIVQAMIADLVGHSLLTTAQALSLVALGIPQLPWWQANGYTGPFSASDLLAAGGIT